MSVKDIVKEHYQKRTITVIQHIPSHNKRMETLEFRNAKKELENVEHLPCFICGTMEKRESHHIIERSYWNGCDLEKVAHFLFHNWDYHGHIKRDFKSEDELFDFFVEHYNGHIVKVVDEETKEEVEYWTCDDTAADTLYNQLILDERCHIGSGTGVHGSDGATFYARMVQRKGFEVSISEKEYEQLGGDNVAIKTKGK